MTGECRHASVQLLDGQTLEVTILPRITVNELHSVVSSHCGLSSSDSQYFALAWIDESSGQFHWLSGEKRLLEAEIPSSVRSKGKLILSHNVRLFVEDISSLSDVSTVQLLFLDVQQQLAADQLDLPISDHIHLAALLLHILNGDYSPEVDREDLGGLLIPLPNRLSRGTLTEREWESKVMREYEKLNGEPRGTAIIRFLEMAQQSPTYGSRFYRVRDDREKQCVLALNSHGMLQYDTDDLSSPLRVFRWKQIENIYYKECHFSIEVADARSVRRRETERSADGEEKRRSRSIPTLHIFTFLVDSPFSCRSLWSASISQHQFYLDQTTHEDENPRDPSSASKGVDHVELCERLNRLVSKSSLAPSAQSRSSLYSSSSASTMPIKLGSSPLRKEGNEKEKEKNGKNEETKKEKEHYRGRSEEEKSADRAKYLKWKEYKKNLEAALSQRVKELRNLCLAEAELTGETPIELYALLAPGEEVPKVKRRVGTTFQISEHLLGPSKVDRLMQLESEIEVNKKIVAAADRLAKDKSMNKSVRKKRMKDLANAQTRLKGLENNLHQMRLSASKPDISASEEKNAEWSTSSVKGPLTTKSCPTTPRGSMPDLAMNMDIEDDEEGNRPSSCCVVDKRRSPSSLMAVPSSISVSSSAAPSGTSSSSLTSNSSMGTGRSARVSKSMTMPDMDEETLTVHPLPPPYEAMGYKSSASYKSSYRTVHYPTLQEQEARKLSGDMDRGRVSSVVHTGWEPYENVRMNGGRTAMMRTSESADNFSTGSLDRRNMRSSPSSSPHMRDCSPSTQRVTTFPVSSNAPLVFKRTPFSTSRLPASHSVHSFPSEVPSSVSTSKLPVQTDAHMEALIQFYRERQRKTPKTATIV